ncbi:hypothetical protein ROHU_015893 [Labeo rohita]|uniref:Uncharacterized protein n=1 Tax=Labeo rohita TaxID=84645 RepID=A0A498NN86_LABRO|nr:hypothetical protein ROHU_026016 [Labeo rohita]RXN32997.1 hypothetical protein ROHU_015893 [Labeo rohita]
MMLVYQPLARMKSRKPPLLQVPRLKISSPVHHKPDLRKLDLSKLTNLIFQNHIITRTLPKAYGQNRPRSITYPDLTNAGFH